MATAASTREGRTLRLLVWIAFVTVLVTAFGYVLIIRAEETYPPEAFVVPFVAAYLALMAAMLGASLREGRLAVRLRPILRGGAAAGLLAIGVLGLMTIGIVLVVAGGLAAAAAVMTLVGRHWSTFLYEGAAALVALALLVAGFEATDRLIVCPAKGFSGGSGYGLVTGGYHYTCVDGRLDFRPGFCSSSGGGIDSNGHAYATNSC
ncbi:MAG TPA: hypothetical protein VNY77_02650 [Candidatus Angelobacter sp.]|nr:hypothetical protein [Candidatus Angelobacter sp.]